MQQKVGHSPSISKAYDDLIQGQTDEDEEGTMKAKHAKIAVAATVRWTRVNNDREQAGGPES